MDNTQPYNIAPAPANNYGPVAPYDYSQFLANTVRPQLTQAPPINIQPPTPTPTAQPGASADGLSDWQRFLNANPDKAKTPQGFQELGQLFKSHLATSLYGKKWSKDGVEQATQEFQDYLDRMAQKHAGQAGAPSAAAAPKEFGLGEAAKVVGEDAASLAFGIGQLIPGTLALADYGVRGAKIFTNKFNALFGHDKPLFTDTGRTGIGDFADYLSQQLNNASETVQSEGTKQSYQDLAAEIQKDPSLGNQLAQYLLHPRALLHTTAGGAGSIVGPIGEIKLASKIPAVARFFQAGGDFSKLVKFATLAGTQATGSQGLAFEDQITGLKPAELFQQHPESLDVYRAGVAAGLSSNEAFRKAQTTVVNRALAYALPAYEAGNVGLEIGGGALGLGGAGQAAVQRFLGGGAQAAARVAGKGAARNAFGLAGRVAKGAASEGLLQEGGAAVLQTAGENTGLDRPTFEGLAGNVAPSVLSGAILGGALHAPGGHGKSLKKQSSGSSQTNTQTSQAGAQAPATQSATPVVSERGDAYSGLPATPMAASGFATLSESFATKMNERAGAFERDLTNKKGELLDTDAIALKAEIKARKAVGESAWDKLSAEQRASLVETYLRTATKHVSIPKLDEFITAYKAQRLGTPAPAPTASGIQETPPPNIEGATQVPGTAAPVENKQVFTGKIANGKYGSSIGSLSDGTRRQLLIDPEGGYFWGDYKEASNLSDGAVLGENTVIEGKHAIHEPAGFETSAEARAAAEQTPQTKTEPGIPPIAPAPAVTPPVQLTGAERASRETALRNSLKFEYGQDATQVDALPANQLESAIETARQARVNSVDAGQQRSRGKLKKETAQAKGPAKETSKGRADYLNNYLLSLIGQANPNDAANKADPRFESAKTAMSNGHIQNADELASFLEAEASRQAQTTPITKPDNRKVSAVMKGVSKANKAVKAEIKGMMRVLTDAGSLTPSEMENSTVDQLRAAYAQVVQNGGTPPVEAPKPKKKKALKKAKGVQVQNGTEVPSKQVTSRPNDVDNLPVNSGSKNKISSAKSSSGSSFGSALVKTLIIENFSKLSGGRKAQNTVNKILERLNSLREDGVKGIPSEKALGDYTFDELVDAESRILDAQIADAAKNERSRNIAKKTDEENKAREAELAKQQKAAPTDLERVLTSINDLSVEEAGKLSDKRLSKANVETLMTIFRAGLKTGKFSELQTVLTRIGVYKPQIDKIVSQAKEARKAEMSRFEGFRNAEDRLLTKSEQNKLATAYFDYTEGNLSLTKFRKAVQAITNDETGNGPEKILQQTAEREKAVVDNLEEPPSPKTQAPLEEGANSKKPAKNRRTAKQSAPVKSVAEQIKERLNTLTAKQRTELVEAVATGDSAIINESLKDLLDTEVITKEDAAFVRKLGSEKFSTTRESARAQLEEARAIIEEADNADPDMMDMLDSEILRMDTEDALNLQPRPISAETQRSLDSLEAELISSDTALKALGIREKGTARGTEAILSRLRELRRNAGLRDAADFAIWLLEKNPHVARTLGLSTKNMTKAGAYSPMQLLAYLNESKAPAHAVVHEILHHMERMLPYQLQQRLRTEYSARLANKLKQVEGRGDKDQIAFIKAVYKSLLEPSEENTKAVKDFITSGKVDSSEFYKYTNPSEYWAETASEILSRRYNPDSWIGKVKEWANEFLQKTKRLFGWYNESEVYNGLKHVLEGNGKFKSTSLVRQGKLEDLSLESKADKEPTTLRELNDGKRISSWQRFWEAATKATQGILEFEAGLNKLGINVDFDDMVSTALHKYRGVVSYNNAVDIGQVVGPVKDHLIDNYSDYASDGKFETALKNLNTYFGNKHLLERNRMQWALEVDLDKGREADRSEIMEEWRDGDITSREAHLRLVSLAQKYGKFDMQDFALNNGMSEATFDAIGRELDRLANEEGMTDKRMEELNTLLDDVRQRQRQRMYESGRVSKKDKWIDLYDYEYYVPLKDNIEQDPALDDFSYVNEDARSLARLNQSIHIAEGRVTFADEPFNRLFTDLARSGERAAYNSIPKAVYLLAVDHAKAMGAHIVRWDGRPKDGYTNGTLDAKGNLKVFKDINKTANSIVYHNGDQHFVVSLPKDSQLLRGLLGMNAVKVPPPIIAPISKVTNFLGRAYTTWSMTWQLSTGFLRDWTAIPAAIATENFDSPIKASGFLARFPVEMLKLYKALPTLKDTMKGDFTAILDTAKDVPDGYADYLVRYLKAGGANNFTEGFEVSKAAELFKGSYNTTDGMWDATKLTFSKVSDFTGNWANFLEQMTRVAAFKSLLASDPDMTDTEAAVKVRRVLDYAESGTYGRIINSLTAFYRTGMTSTDTIIRSFRAKDGSFDAKKFAVWTSTYGGIGFLMFSLAAGMLGDDDEKDKDGKDIKVPRIRKIKLSTLTQKFPIPVGDKMYGMPIGLGIPQVMLAPGIILGAVSSGHSTMAEAAGEMWQVFNRNGPSRLAGTRGVKAGEFPTDPSNVVASIVKSVPGLNLTAVAPILAADENLDTFGQPIHRDHYDDKKPKYGQAGPNTPKEYVDMSRNLYEMTGGHIDMFPEDLKYYAVNYGGQNVSDLLKATIDLNNKNLFGEMAEYNPLTSRFEIKDLDYYNSNDMYDTIDKIGTLDKKYGAVWSDARISGKTAEEATDIANAARAKDPAVAAAVAQAKVISNMIRKRTEALRRLRADRTISDTRRQAERKRLDSELRQATLKAQYLLEKAQ